MFRAVTIGERAVIQPYLEHAQEASSAFSSLVGWTHEYHYQYAILHDVLILAFRYNKKPYVKFYGEGDLAAAIAQAHELLGDFSFHFLNEEMKNRVDAVFPGQYHLSPCENMSDYVYLTEDLIELKGKKYHAKRNHVNKFMASYDWEYVPVTAEQKPELMRFFDEINTESDQELAFERGAMEVFVHNMEALCLKACLLQVKGKTVACAIGERQRADTAHIMIEKADTSYQGSYAMINREFLVREFADTTYVDREEDMGIEGLRKAKMSYRPVKRLKIFCAGE